LKNLLQNIWSGYFIDANEDEETQNTEKDKVNKEIETLKIEKTNQEAVNLSKV
jgi:predicted DNA-binding transcriptional regulator